MTNPVLDVIFSRRSHRGYSQEQITDEQLNILLDAAQAAPSARNTQPWHITVVQNQALLARMNAAAREGIIASVPEKVRDRYASNDYSVFHHAPTVLFYSCPALEDMRYAQTDCGISIENVVLAAESIGLGTVVLGLPREAFVSPEGDAFRKELQFPEGYDFILAVSVGIPTDDKEAHPIKPGRISYVL